MTLSLESLIRLAEFGVAVVCLGAVLHLVIRNSVAACLLLASTWFLTVALRDSFDLSATFAGVRVGVLDVLSLLLIGVGATRMLVQGVRVAARGLVLTLLVLLAFHLARGVADFGIQTAVNEARNWVYFTAALVYAATLPTGPSRREWAVLAGAGALLAVVAVPYLIVDGVHSSSGVVVRNGHLISARPITADGALLILQAGLLAVSLGWPTRRLGVAIASTAAAIAVLLEHRTVWVAFVVVLVGGFVLWSRSSSRSQQTVFAATGGVFLLIPVAVWSFLSTAPFVASVHEATTSNSTFAWRTTSWRELLSSHHSFVDLVSGGPSGAAWNRVLNGRIVDASPHNNAVDAYLRFGLPGVAVLILLAFLLWHSRSRLASAAGIPGAVVVLLLATQVVFSVAYTLDSMQGLILGFLVAALAARSPVASRDRRTRFVDKREYAGAR